AVYLAGESAMRVRPEEGRTTVQLEQGGIRFQFPKGQDFRIVAGGVEIGPEVLQRVASENATKVSGVVVLDGGETLVHTLSGGLKVSSGSAAAPHSVRVGQTFAFDVSKGSFIRVVRPQGQPTEEDDDDHRLIWWLVGGAALLYLVDQADGEEKSIVR
ncbi:MAG: hypothetical protein LJE84_04930, partial [Gammaproteobacteria bacterium]|nr:hypothetical protein [Gammaproteobacteria bacterium]